MTTHKPVDWTKELQTLGGHKARLLGVLNTASEFKYVVAVMTADGSEWVANFKESGTYGSETRYNLTNPPTRIKRDVWVNVYRDSAAMHNTRLLADQISNANRLACVKVTIDCAEGEGL